MVMKKYLFLTGCLLISFLLGVIKGAVPIHILHPSVVEKNILLSVRIPRVIMAGEVGACLVVAGILFQYVMQNPLADSFTTGASSSSALGAVIAIVIGANCLILPLSVGFCLLGLIIVYKISSYQGKLSPLTLLLAGIVISTFSSALISLLKFASEESITSIVFWLMGGLQNATLKKDLILLVVLFAVLIRLNSLSLSIDLMAFDDETAISSGVNIYRLRKELMFYGALLTGVCVAFSGIIGFVGLIVPHILRLAKVLKAKELLLTGALSGASFLIIADLVSRIALKGGEELPIGILTSSIGGVFFLYLLVQNRKRLYQWDT